MKLKLAILAVIGLGLAMCRAQVNNQVPTLWEVKFSPGPPAQYGTVAGQQIRVASAQTITAFYVFLKYAPAGGASMTYTLLDNGAKTTHTCTITGPARNCGESTASVTAAAGDALSVQAAAGN